MYPLLCSGGFPVPEKDGQFDIVAVQVMPVSAASAVVAQLRDDNVGGAPASQNYRHIVGLKSDGNSSPFIVFDPPLKTRKGLRATTLTNGVCTVYVR
jgi:hypothetical protein